jgi:hypothetical protein
MKPKLTWLLFPISLGAFVLTWGGWAKLATMTGYTKVEMIGGWSWSQLNTGFALPVTVEPFGMLAMAVAFNPRVRRWARLVAGGMALATLTAASVCQAVVHNLTVSGKTSAPEVIVSIASVLPPIVLGLGAALAMLNSVRVPDGETSQGTSRDGVWGRVGRALGDAAASQAERLATASQASRDAVAAASQTSQDGVPGEPAGTIPASAESSRKTSAGTSQESVPAGRKPATTARPDREVLSRDVQRLRSGTDPATGRPLSFVKIAALLGISKSEAQRLAGTSPASQAGTLGVVPDQAGTSRGDDAGTSGVLVGVAAGDARAA